MTNQVKRSAIQSLRISIVMGIITGAMMSACEPLALGTEELAGDPPRFKSAELTAAPDAPTSLRVMAWNIKYGAARAPFWFDCWGDQVSLSADQVERNMDELSALIREADPDVLMVEEIELHSRRSAYYNMIQGLLDKTELNYAAYYETWNSRYVPSEGLGRMSLGNAIFSKYPIKDASKIAQVDREDLDPVTGHFYIKRFIGRAEIELASESRVAAYVVHVAAYDQDGTKAKQIQQMYDVALEETLPFVIGGDFNELPPTAARIERFFDEREEPVCGDDFEQPPYTPELMTPFYSALKPWIDSARYGVTEREQSRYFTHSVLGPQETNARGERGQWNRTLDYLFASGDTEWVAGTTDVLQKRGQAVGVVEGQGQVMTTESALDWTLEAEPLELSDHAPVFGVWSLGETR